MTFSVLAQAPGCKFANTRTMQINVKARRSKMLAGKVDFKS